MTNQNSVEKALLATSCLLTPTSLKKMPLAIYDHMSFYLGDQFIFCGGHKKPGQMSAECFGIKADPGADWSPLTDMPRQLINAGTAVTKQKAYLLGGFEEKPAEHVLSLDATTLAWTEEPILSPGRELPCAVAYGSTIYVTGGKIAAEPPASVNLKTVEKLEGGAWSKLADMAQERHNHGCAIVKNGQGQVGILVVGGTGDKPDVSKTAEFLDLTAPGAQWQKMPEVDEELCCRPQVGIVEDKIIAIGGKLKPSKEAHILDTTAGKWEKAPYKLKIKRVQAHGAIVPKSFHTC